MNIGYVTASARSLPLTAALSFIVSLRSPFGTVNAPYAPLDIGPVLNFLMGIQGLLPFLRSIQKQRHLSELSGQTLAVDGYCWLHRGTYTCSIELATGRKTSK